MDNINEHIGSRIRMYRKARGLTIQELADRIHKCKASISKYENGETTLDVMTLYDIAQALQVSWELFMDYRPTVIENEVTKKPSEIKSPFFRANKLYFYYYDGRYKRLKDGIIDITKAKDKPGEYTASLVISADSPTGRGGEVYYLGKVVYSDMLIRFSFVNQINTLEEDLLYIFNPLEVREATDGLLCGISSSDFMPCAFKCLVTLKPQEHNAKLKSRLLFTKKELQQWQKMNMLVVDNRDYV